MEPETARADRIITLPNVISLVRLACVPLFVALLVGDLRIEAALVLGILGASDWVDGWIARHFGQESDLGKVLDPVADRILLITAGLALLIQGSVPLVVGILVLTRELAVSIAVLGLAVVGAPRIDVRWSGKAGTLALMCAFPFYLWADSIQGSRGHDVLLGVAWPFAIIGLVLAYHAAVLYIPEARGALADAQAERSSAPSPSPRSRAR